MEQDAATVLWKKFYVHLAGKTNNAHQAAVVNLKRIGHTEVDSPERSDYILVFCPIVSKVGTDIREALESTEKNNPGGKPIILVVMHHTFDPDRVIAESRRLVKNQNVKLTVDCLIYEGELLKCHRNDTAWSEVQKIFGVSEVNTVFNSFTSIAVTSLWKKFTATSQRNDQPASDMKQKGATGENPNAQSSEINNPTNTNDPVGQEETTETNPQSAETDNTDEPMEQSPSESSQQGRSGEVQGVDQTINDKPASSVEAGEATETNPQSTETDSTTKTNEPMKQSSSESSKQGRSGEVQGVHLLWKKFFLVGETTNAVREFVAKFEKIGQKQAESPKESDYILVFCPISSNVAEDIRRALESAPGGKPIILVVMHHTKDCNIIVFESRRLEKNQNVKLTVDCLIYEGELLKCDRNDTAWSEVQKIFVSEADTTQTSQINDQPASDMKQEGATGENTNAQCSEINNPTNTNDPVGQEETTETNPQSPETDNTAEPMEQSPSESSQQGTSGEVQGVDQTTDDQDPLDEGFEHINDEEIKSLPESNSMNVNQPTINQASSDMKQEGATGENTDPQSTETDKTNEPMEQSPSESSEQVTWKKFFVHLAGKTNNAHQDFVKEFKRINHTEVDSPESSDYILVFCPVVSRVGTDIGEALESTEKNNPGGKPIILVVMHHTFDPDRVIAESRRLVNNQNVKLTVDCLIYEGELLKCDRNDTAWSEVQKIFGVSEVNTVFNSFPSFAVEVTKPAWLKFPEVSLLTLTVL
ncbi:uncharacterized protein LOC104937737 isoform X3 [Larimichthys crocea]|uniref:uncharacterized protein LOC104937737 isoform X3 n=1 Tax=Larimichthys crocea TaxID=215358 RepID=UPI000F5DD7E9|nr:uncharacterized protein LOC104937737 isoform X3 [Larimichthys crocea]